MKLLFLIMFFPAGVAFATKDCKQYEAQIMAEVKKVEIHETYCLVFLHDPDHHFKDYRPHFYCPLALEEIEKQGVRFRLRDKECSYKADEKFSGRLVQKKNSTIIFSD